MKCCLDTGSQRFVLLRTSGCWSGGQQKDKENVCLPHAPKSSRT